MKKRAMLATYSALSVLLATATVSQASAASSSSTPFVVNNWSVNPGGPMNPLNSSGNYVVGIDIIPLGIENPTSSNPNTFFPSLAARWKISKGGKTVTVWLQKNAKWSDGSPVTANDVKTSAALYSLNGIAEGYALNSVHTVGKNEIIFNEAPGSTYGQFARGVLSLNILPASVYGKFLPSDIWSLISQYQYTGANAGLLAAKKDAATKIAEILKTVAAYSPPKEISAGPYVIKSINPGEILMVKNPYFYDASKIKINEVDVRASSSNQQIWNWLMAGQIDLTATGGMTNPLVKRIQSLQGNKFFKVPDFSDAALAFNSNTYPYNMVQVRQAFAYIINTKSVWSVGEPVGGYPSKWTTGMTDQLAQQYLSSSQLAKLNPYKPNAAKATQLLKSVGFTKKGSQWYLPNGKPFTVNLYTVSGYNDWDQGATVIQSELNQFGIKTQVDLAANGGVYYQNYTQGKYATYINNVFTGPYVDSSFNSIYGTADGYSIENGKLVYSAPAKSNTNYVGLPETISVKGYGKVSPGALTFQLTKQLSAAEQKKIVQELAVTTNQYVPFIGLWDYAQSGFMNTASFTNYPLNNPPVMELNEVYNFPIGFWQMLGYVQPK